MKMCYDNSHSNLETLASASLLFFKLYIQPCFAKGIVMCPRWSPKCVEMERLWLRDDHVNKVPQAVQDKVVEISFANNCLRELSAQNIMQALCDKGSSKTVNLASNWLHVHSTRCTEQLRCKSNLFFYTRSYVFRHRIRLLWRSLRTNLLDYVLRSIELLHIFMYIRGARNTEKLVVVQGLSFVVGTDPRAENRCSVVHVRRTTIFQWNAISE